MTVELFQRNIDSVQQNSKLLTSIGTSQGTERGGRVVGDVVDIVFNLGRRGKGDVSNHLGLYMLEPKPLIWHGN